jgi:hypothetical protein
MSKYKVKSTNARIADTKEELEGEILLAEEIENVTELPTAVEAHRGKIKVLLGGTGVADVPYICIKNASDEYEYDTITIVAP